MKNKTPEAPKAYHDFVARFPKVTRRGLRCVCPTKRSEALTPSGVHRQV